jgi:DNA-binding MarR family transcriptional regulator
LTNFVNGVYHQAMKMTADIRQHTNRKSLVHPLAFLANDFREQIRLHLKARGHRLQTAHAKILVHLDMEGTRLTELARRAGISKQAMGKLVNELEAIGYVERAVDDSDGRAWKIGFTPKGLALLKDSGEIVEEIWQEYAKLMGEKRLERFRDELNTLYLNVKQRRTS